jgi:foldase protein PrsA
MKEKKQDNLSGREQNKVTSIFSNKEIWISGLIGLILGAAILYLLGMLGLPGLWNETIAKFKGGKITENNLYENMKKYYTVSYILESIDDTILKQKYELTDAQKQEVEEEVNSLLNMYAAYYGYTEETFLQENGFESKDDFVDYLTLDYRRNLYCIDYFKTLIPAEDINNYYNENIQFGEIKTKHMLVQTSDEITDKDALKLANEIIAKLNNGTSFDDVANEYGEKIVSEEVPFDNFNYDTLAEEYVNASKELSKDSYTKEPVKTSFGYHIIYCIDKAEKPSFEEVENKIVEVLAENLESEDQYIKYKALIKLREEYNLKFTDEKFEQQYKEYCQEINGTVEE